MQKLSRKTFTAGSAAAVAGVAFIRRRARAAQFTWKFGIDTPVDHPINTRAVEAFGRIRKETGGQLDITSYPNSALGSDPNMLLQLRQGALEMLAYAGGILDTVVSLSSIENVAFAFPTREKALAAMDGDLGALVRKAIVDKGIMVFDKIYENGYREFTTSPHPIRNAADLQGLKLRVSPGKLRLDSFRSMGVAVTPIPPNELYTALQTHLVDGQETGVLLIETLRLYEVQRYCSLSHHMWSGYWNLVNLDKWNSLPPKFQESLRRNMNLAALKERRDTELLTGATIDKLRRQGMAINKVDVESLKAKLSAAGYYPRWKKEFGDEAWAALEKYAGKLS
jgi:tripartite ATP-independent transporter DctP family solute receptor